MRLALEAMERYLDNFPPDPRLEGISFLSSFSTEGLKLYICLLLIGLHGDAFGWTSGGN